MRKRIYDDCSIFDVAKAKEVFFNTGKADTVVASDSWDAISKCPDTLEIVHFTKAFNNSEKPFEVVDSEGNKSRHTFIRAVRLVDDEKETEKCNDETAEAIREVVHTMQRVICELYKDCEDYCAELEEDDEELAESYREEDTYLLDTLIEDFNASVKDCCPKLFAPWECRLLKEGKCCDDPEEEEEDEEEESDEYPDDEEPKKESKGKDDLTKEADAILENAINLLVKVLEGAKE